MKETKTYLTKSKIKAVPFDKGVGYCVMKDETYITKLTDILDNREFERAPSTGEKHPAIHVKQEINQTKTSKDNNQKLRKLNTYDAQEHHLLECMG